MATSRKGNKLLLIDGYTFYKHYNYWDCSMKNKYRCTARIRLDDDGNIKSIKNVHTHEPRKYFNGNGVVYFY